MEDVESIQRERPAHHIHRCDDTTTEYTSPLPPPHHRARQSAATITDLNFTNELSVAVITFADDVVILSEPSPVSDVAESLQDRVLSLVADGSTSLFQAVCSSVELLQEMQKEDLAAGESRLYGITLLSDGEDTAGTISENQMFATCLPANAEADGVKIFPIAFGDDADTDVLQRVARVSGGKVFQADPSTIDRVYVSISERFPLPCIQR